MSSSGSGPRKFVQATLTDAFIKVSPPNRSETSRYFEKPTPIIPRPTDTLDDALNYPIQEDESSKELPIPILLTESSLASSLGEAEDNLAQDIPRTRFASPESQDGSVHLDPSARPPSPVAPPQNSRRSELAKVAAETKKVLPRLLRCVAHAPAEGRLYERKRMPYLDQKYCPGFQLPLSHGKATGCVVRVIDADTFDAAIALSHNPATLDKQPPVVLNMASEKHGGGGWLKGSLAQEEALCYRSSLSFTLKRCFYPIPDNAGIYSPTVIVFRESMRMGHGFIKAPMLALPIMSVISVAAVRNPRTTKATPPRYERPQDRELMVAKMRTTLRIAAINNHRRLVLGALGCGAFRNPQLEVAEIWKQVLLEKEFSGGWWESVIFAVMEKGDGKADAAAPDTNFGIFYRVLDGTIV